MNIIFLTLNKNKLRLSWMRNKTQKTFYIKKPGKYARKKYHFYVRLAMIYGKFIIKHKRKKIERKINKLKLNLWNINGELNSEEAYVRKETKNKVGGDLISFFGENIWEKVIKNEKSYVLQQKWELW